MHLRWPFQGVMGCVLTHTCSSKINAVIFKFPHHSRDPEEANLPPESVTRVTRPRLTAPGFQLGYLLKVELRFSQQMFGSLFASKRVALIIPAS